MEGKGLLSLLTFSGKRRDILFMLQREPKTLQEIRDRLGVTSPEIIPQIKKLEKNNLIHLEGKNYFLTEMGYIVTHSYNHLIKTLDIFEKDIEFWKRHKINGIPYEFKMRLNELGNYRIFGGTPTEIFKPHNEYIKNLLQSNCIEGVSSVLHPDYPKYINMLADRGMPISIILTEDVFKKMKEDYSAELEKGLEYNNVQVMVFNEKIEFTFTVTDLFLSMRLFFNNGTYDFYNNIISYEKSALEWGNDLFKYFEKRSKKVDPQSS
ncbi:MAG: winged helix-turn-helix domain-containing protein [Candidatus Methanoperedens sp.]|nr:winged helix-turn-helix domain-containing protein [Candidatus Methanoperedens sp.]MCZ7371869.1 winged helix-turn-helix domain-containing protein [Candidatus Methanoperedens sp.]